MTRTAPRRPAFTLVELLVAISIAIALAGMAVLVAESGAFGSQKVISGADRASGWLLVAKQRAVRDQRPRGVRFLLTRADQMSPPVNPPDAATDPARYYVAREAQYIEVPDAWTPDLTRPEASRAFLAVVGQTDPGTGALLPDTTPLTAASYGAGGPVNGRRVFVILPNLADQTEFAQKIDPQGGYLLTLPGTGATYRVDKTYSPNGLTVTAKGTQWTNGGPQGTPVVELALGANTTVASPQFTLPDLGATNSGPFAPMPPAPNATTAGTWTQPAPASLVVGSFAFTAGFSGGTSAAGGPQPILGEPLLQLNGLSIVIDIRENNLTFDPRTGDTTLTPPEAAVVYPTTAGVTLAGPAGSRFFDILFGPNGQVVGGTGGGIIALWLRDADKTSDPRQVGAGPGFTESLSNTAKTKGFDFAGEQVLVVVYPRTGMIATHPVLPPTQNPYQAARDGQNSGL